MTTINVDTCVKNLIWEMFEISHGLDECRRINFNVRHKGSVEYNFRTFSVSLTKELLTIKVKTSTNDNIGEALSSFKRAFREDEEQYVGGFNLKEVDRSIEGVVEVIKKIEKVPKSATYTFAPLTINDDLNNVPKKMKETFISFLFPEFAEYLNTSVGVREISGFNHYKKTKDILLTVSGRLKERQDAEPLSFLDGLVFGRSCFRVSSSN